MPVDRVKKMIENGNREVSEKEAAESSKGAENDKTFKTSLMHTGLKARESPAAHGTPGQPPSGTPPGKHLGWEKGKHNPHRSPSASPSPSASASASASATASATATATVTATP